MLCYLSAMRSISTYLSSIAREWWPSRRPFFVPSSASQLLSLIRRLQTKTQPSRIPPRLVSISLCPLLLSASYLEYVDFAIAISRPEPHGEHESRLGSRTQCDPLLRAPFVTPWGQLEGSMGFEELGVKDWSSMLLLRTYGGVVRAAFGSTSYSPALGPVLRPQIPSARSDRCLEEAQMVFGSFGRCRVLWRTGGGEGGLQGWRRRRRQAYCLDQVGSWRSDGRYQSAHAIL